MPLQTIHTEALKDDEWDDFLSTQPKAYHEQTSSIQAKTRAHRSRSPRSVRQVRRSARQDQAPRFRLRVGSRRLATGRSVACSQGAPETGTPHERSARVLISRAAEHAAKPNRHIDRLIRQSVGDPDIE